MIPLFNITVLIVGTSFSHVFVFLQSSQSYVFFLSLLKVSTYNGPFCSFLKDLVMVLLLLALLVVTKNALDLHRMLKCISLECLLIVR